MRRILIVALMAVACCGFAGCKKIYYEPDVSGFNSEGASEALFSVAPGRQVRFSRGNLQYNPKSKTWRFAEHQYNIIGRDNKNISANYDGWIDLFGWGTSGYNSGAAAYQPWSSSIEASDYFAERADYDLTGEYAHGDWGVHNAITNGGNAAGKWRTLTAEEWRYLLDGGSDGPRHDKCSVARIIFCYPAGNGTYDGYEGYMGYDNSGVVEGLIVLPDNWVQPSSVYLDPSDMSYGPFLHRSHMVMTDNSGDHVGSYDLATWSVLEAAGAVFLPLTTYRLGKQVQEAPYQTGSGGLPVWEESNGFYWSTTGANSTEAKALRLFYRNVNWSASIGDAIVNKAGHLGLAVRLVQDK